MFLTEQHQNSLAWLEDVTASGTSFGAICEQLIAHLEHTYSHYHWVGIYMLEKGKLKLWSWNGPEPTEPMEIELSSGLHSFAASTGQLINVTDTHEDDRYLQCFLNTRSEMVVPIQAAGCVYGALDVASETIAAFTKGDELFLTEICVLLGVKAAAEGLACRPRLK